MLVAGQGNSTKSTNALQQQLRKVDTDGCSDCCVDTGRLMELCLSEAGHCYDTDVKLLSLPPQLTCGVCSQALLVTPLCTDEHSLPYHCEDLPGPLQQRKAPRPRRRKKVKEGKAIASSTATQAEPPFTHIRYGLTLFPECALLTAGGGALEPVSLPIAGNYV